MTIDSFIRRLDRSFSWLYYKRQWAEWELIFIAIIAMLLLLWILRRQSNGASRGTHAGQASKHAPIIGTKLADHHHNRQAIENAREHHSDLIAHLRGRKKKKKTAATRLEALSEQIRQLQSTIDKYKDREDRFVEKVAELAAANEKLRSEVTKYTQDEQQPREPAEHALEETTVSSVADIEHGQDAAQPRRAIEPPKLKTVDSASADRQTEHAKQERQTEIYPELMVTEEHQDDQKPEEDTEPRRPSPRDNEPLDIQKLKAIAALARQIQGYPRHG